MAWRTVIVSQPARLRLAHRSLVIDQGETPVYVPLEDISVLIIDQLQVSLSSQLLAACAEGKIATITVGKNHQPNGVLLPFHSHSRVLKVQKAQLALPKPQKKRLWQQVIRQKIHNQATVLSMQGLKSPSARLERLIHRVKSGDPQNCESEAALLYFRALFGPRFTRAQDRFYNSAINYGYAVIRAALARSLVAHGLNPAFGLHHRSEQNAFNLADDFIEPYRAIVDEHILYRFPEEPDRELTPNDKARIVDVLHQDAPTASREKAERMNILNHTEQTVTSFVRRLNNPKQLLSLPLLAIHSQRAVP